MGIEGFFRTLEKRKNINTGILVNYKEKTNINYFYVDFNSLLYNISAKVEEELGIILFIIIYKNNKIHELNREKITNELVLSILKKWDFKIRSETTIEDYKKYFNPDFVEKKIIGLIKEHILWILSTYMMENKLKKIFISIDGIPNMAKIVEQKQRRYTSFIRSGILKKIFNEFKLNKKIPENRILFEENRYRFDRNKIVTWSDYMKEIENALTDETWVKNSIKKKYINLEEFVVSGASNPGEGEKKIMEEILINKINANNKWMLYSPDADIILLSIILQNMILGSEFSVLHFDQETSSHSFADITKFINYITNYITNQKSNIKVTPELKKNISNDFVMIANVFGNDFLPKIISINVKSDFQEILNKYSYMFDEDGYLHNIVNSHNGKIDLNIKNFLKYLKIISKMEPELIRQKYISDNYNTYKIKKFLSQQNPNKEITNYTIYYFVIQYINDYGQLIRKIKNGQNVYDTNINIIKKILFFETKIKIGKINNESSENLMILFKNYVDEIIKNYKIPGPFRTSKKYKNKVEEFQIKKYLDDLINELIYNENNNELMEYDLEQIKFEWKIGKYAKMLSSEITSKEDRNFGIVDFDYKKLKLYMPEVNTHDYNKLYLGKDINPILNEYIYGSFWVFDFYFNRNNKLKNLNIVSTWFYSKHKSPLLKDVVTELERLISTGKISDVINNLYLYDVDRKNFLNRYEQMLYITPVNKIDLVISGYENLLMDKSLFPDMELYTDKIWNFENGNIDCRRITFITKCDLKKIKNYEFEYFKEKINKYRKFFTKDDYIKYGYSIENKIIIFSYQRKIGRYIYKYKKK